MNGCGAAIVMTATAAAAPIASPYRTRGLTFSRTSHVFGATLTKTSRIATRRRNSSGKQDARVSSGDPVEPGHRQQDLARDAQVRGAEHDEGRGDQP